MARIKTSDFPKTEQRNYETMRRHFDSVKPWQSKYNPDNERPIGQSACKLTSDGDRFSIREPLTAKDRAEMREGARFNKAMRLLDDESIAFRLYDTDCVIYHPDGTITVQGFASVSTNDFVNALTPIGIMHTCRGKGRDNAFEPVLFLGQPCKRWFSSDYRYPDVHDRWYMGADYKQVVNCEWPVLLQCQNATWQPAEPDALHPFMIYRVDHRAARLVARQYNLAKLEPLIIAAEVLTQLPARSSERSWAGGGPRFGVIMDALRDERYMDAICEMPRGEKIVFSRRFGTPNGIEPGFLRRLRNHIYEHEGVVDRIPMQTLTPAQYQRYKSDQTKFS